MSLPNNHERLLPADSPPLPQEEEENDPAPLTENEDEEALASSLPQLTSVSSLEPTDDYLPGSVTEIPSQCRQPPQQQQHHQFSATSPQSLINTPQVGMTPAAIVATSAKADRIGYILVVFVWLTFIFCIWATDTHVLKVIFGTGMNNQGVNAVATASYFRKLLARLIPLRCFRLPPPNDVKSLLGSIVQATHCLLLLLAISNHARAAVGNPGSLEKLKCPARNPNPLPSAMLEGSEELMKLTYQNGTFQQQQQLRERGIAVRRRDLRSTPPPPSPAQEILSAAPPGAIDKGGRTNHITEESSSYRWPQSHHYRMRSTCSKCQGRWKPPRAHHCDKCATCIFRMDHHCFWINNCIGIGNQKYFILFLAYTMSLCIYNLVLVGAALANWIFVHSPRRVNIKTFLVLLVVVGVSLAFYRMSKGFLLEMIEAIATNSTLVETVKDIRGRKQTFLKNFEEIFGTRWYLWPLPLFPYGRIVDFSEPLFSNTGTTALETPSSYIGKGTTTTSTSTASTTKLHGGSGQSMNHLHAQRSNQQEAVSLKNRTSSLKVASP